MYLLFFPIINLIEAIVWHDITMIQAMAKQKHLQQTCGMEIKEKTWFCSVYCGDQFWRIIKWCEKNAYNICEIFFFFLVIVVYIIASSIICAAQTRLLWVLTAFCLFFWYYPGTNCSLSGKLKFVVDNFVENATTLKSLLDSKRDVNLTKSMFAESYMCFKWADNDLEMELWRLTAVIIRSYGVISKAKKKRTLKNARNLCLFEYVN